MAIASDGFIFVPRCVDDTTVQALRAEADSLFRLKRSKDALLSEDEYLDKGCALDFFTTSGLAENDEARVSMDEYMSRRNGTRRRQSHRCEERSATASFTASSGTSSGSSILTTPPASPNTASSSPPRSSEIGAVPTANRPPKVDSPNPQWTENHVAVVRDAIFGALAGHARDALKAAPSAAKTHAAGSTLLLFNEQFVVKPPQSSIEFGWHTDEREQLAMCVFAPGANPPVYISVWLALDDCDAVNGCLEIFPQAWDRKRLQAPSDEHEASVLCLPAKAGAAVVFLSNVWHRSGPNQTDQPRRVFYAQYSLDVIRAAPSDPRPLSLAVPCLPQSCCSTSVAPGKASDHGIREAGGDDVGARNGEGARRLRGEVETPPRRSSDGVDGCSVGDGRRQRVEGGTTPCRSSSPAKDARTKNVVSTIEKARLSLSSDAVDGAMATRRRRRPEEEGVKRDTGEEGGDRDSKRSRA